MLDDDLTVGNLSTVPAMPTIICHDGLHSGSSGDCCKASRSMLRAIHEVAVCQTTFASPGSVNTYSLTPCDAAADAGEIVIVDGCTL